MFPIWNDTIFAKEMDNLQKFQGFSVKTNMTAKHRGINSSVWVEEKYSSGRV